MKKKIKNIVLVLLGGIIFSGIGVFAATIINANQISYSNSKSSATNVQGALDELYSKVSIIEKAPSDTKGLLGIIYYNPKKGVKCTVEEYNKDLELYKTNNNKNSPTNQKDGCMKWYAYFEGPDYYLAILDHNTKSTVAYNSGNTNTTPKEIQTELDKLVSENNWKVTPRLITAQEIANITGNTSWTAGGSHFYFDSNSTTQTATSQGASKYYWLFDYTDGCTSHGCKTADSSTAGYWTSTPRSNDSTRVWHVYVTGYIVGQTAQTPIFGLRPVIAIPKSSL